jgi:putative transposase
MANGLRRSAHSVGEYNAHLVLTPAYRRAIFADPLVRELTAAYLMTKAHELGIEVPAIEFGTDHAHLFLANWRRYAPQELARQLKGYTSYMMRKGHWQLFCNLLWRKKFWTAGYFFRTVGAVSADTVKKYILESQTKHWEDPTAQKTLLGFHT